VTSYTVETVNDPDWAICPVCKSHGVMGHPWETNGIEAVQPCTCEDCGSHWDEVYVQSKRLLHVIEVD